MHSNTAPCHPHGPHKGCVWLGKSANLETGGDLRDTPTRLGGPSRPKRAQCQERWAYLAPMYHKEQLGGIYITLLTMIGEHGRNMGR